MDISETRRLRINVSGKKFEIYENLLLKYPRTLLGNQNTLRTYYDFVRNEYYFDRNAEAFEGIFHFYQSNGSIKCPMLVPADVFYHEVKFFGLFNCLKSRSKCDEILLNLISKENEEFQKQHLNILSKKDYNFVLKIDEPNNRCLKLIWKIFERPHSTIIGRIVTFICLTTVLLSITALCVETVLLKKSKNFYEDELQITRRNDFFIIELTCTVIFTTELTLRFVAAKYKIKFLKDKMNIIDIIAVLPFWLQWIVDSSISNQTRQFNTYGFSVLRTLRLTRVLRIFKLSRHIRLVAVIGRILYECGNEIKIFVTFLCINIVVFSTLMYFIESLGDRSTFDSIPHTFWWAVISFTSVGYGDLIPTSALGKLFGSVFILFGILVALLPVPILAAKFEKVYKDYREEINAES